MTTSGQIGVRLGPLRARRWASQTEGDRLFRNAICYLESSAPEMRQAMRATDEIGRRRLLSQSISLKLRIRAVVWKRGAHQPGGPPLRTTAARHFRSSPPGMDAEARSVGLCNFLGPHQCASNGTEATGSPSRRIEIVAWGGDRLSLLSEEHERC